jgi:GntR family transcriptional regulator
MIPAYVQLKESLLEKIRKGEFPVGGLIPSERELADTLKISRMTVRQALNELVLDGVLVRERGRGTFVTIPKLEQKNIMSFSDTVRQKGLEPSATVLRFETLEASKALCAVLDLEKGEKIYNLKRLRSAGGIPVAIEQNYIPEKYCPKLDQYDLTSSLYNIFKNNYSFNISFVDHVITSSKPGKEEKELLSISGSVPILKVTCTNYTENNLKLFFEESVYRSDEYQYNMRVYVR